MRPSCPGGTVAIGAPVALPVWAPFCCSGSQNISTAGRVMSRAVCALTPGSSTIRRSLPERCTCDSDTPNGLIRLSTMSFAASSPSSICSLVTSWPGDVGLQHDARAALQVEAERHPLAVVRVVGVVASSSDLHGRSTPRTRSGRPAPKASSARRAGSGRAHPARSRRSRPPAIAMIKTTKSRSHHRRISFPVSSALSTAREMLASGPPPRAARSPSTAR